MPTLEEIHSKLEKLEVKQDILSDKVDIIIDYGQKNNKLAIENSVVLKEHERRSTASEVRIGVLEEKDISFHATIKVISWLGVALVGLATILGTVFGWLSLTR